MSKTNKSVSVVSELVSDMVHPPFGQYAHGVCAELAKSSMVITSGHLGISKDGAIPEDAYEQACLCFSNIAETLACANMSAENVIQLKGFVTQREYFAAYMKARDEFLNNRAIASTLLVVSGFTSPDFKVEVEALALAP